MNETMKRAAGLASGFSYISVPVPRQANMLVLSPEATSCVTHDFCTQSIAWDVECQCVPFAIAALNQSYLVFVWFW